MLALCRHVTARSAGTVPQLLRPVACRAASSTTSSPKAGGGGGKSRQWPDEPRVSVGIVALRPSPTAAGQTEVLLIQRGKEPSKGQWSFPGGSLELGETMVQCAERELLEETGIQMYNAGDSAAGISVFSRTLQVPTPFAAADVISRGADGRVEFHYAIVEVAARVADPEAVPQAADDVDDVRWVLVTELGAMKDLTKNCDAIACDAAARFDVT